MIHLTSLTSENIRLQLTVRIQEFITPYFKALQCITPLFFNFIFNPFKKFIDKENNQYEHREHHDCHGKIPDQRRPAVLILCIS